MFDLNFIKKYWPTIFSIVILFIFVITLFEILNFDLNQDGSVRNKRRLTIEPFGPSSSNEFIQKINDNDPVKLNDICKSFSNDACKQSSFCVLLNGSKCVGGNSNGPTFLTENGKDIDFTHYIHKDTCKGQCPT
jgi:hypothetical protein